MPRGKTFAVTTRIRVHHHDPRKEIQDSNGKRRMKDHPLRIPEGDQ
jgi:hypothetical protein